MSTYNMIRPIGIIMVAIVAAAVACPASTAQGRSDRFARANWPEETIYQPECRVVQADGTWLPLRSLECDW
jgi:hypothetical protein